MQSLRDDIAHYDRFGISRVCRDYTLLVSAMRNYIGQKR